MNARKKNGEFAGVRKKLTAAVAMLLVATIMMASSTYAWFTLSTAPEVTGITTSVGANGNLEMALSNQNGTAPGSSNVGDSNNALTWGNLVQIGDNYGLNNIMLKPSRLNLTGTTNNATISSNALLVPSYGADGRVKAFDTATMSGTFDAKKSGFVAGSAIFGVRGLGKSTSMSETEQTLYTALISVENSISTAKSIANESITLYGNTLANLAVRHGLNAGTDEDVYKKAEVETINHVLDKLTESKNAIEKALMNAVLVLAASEGSNKETYDAVKNAVAASGATLSTVETAASGLTLPESYNSAKAKWEEITIPAEIKNISEDTASETATVGTNTWESIKDAVNGIVDTAGITLNGKEIADIKKMNNLGDLIALANNPTLEMSADSGIYGNIAVLVGNLGANIGDILVKNGSMSVTVNSAYMKTTVEGTALLKTLGTELASKNALTLSDEETSVDKMVNDLYAFAIDLWFRTNASGSDLLLKTDATNRIYSTGGSTETMGGGSTYTFTLPNDSVNLEAAKNLAGCIHVLFTDRSGNVLGVAGLDTTNLVQTTAENGTVEYTAKLYMQAYEIVADGGYNKITFGELKKGANENKITGLNQNEAKMISAYVYLDGDSVDNSMVAATNNVTMTGSLNLQFGSSAELNPMDYSPLKGNEIATEPTKND